MERPLISIIIPVYRVEKYLEQCVDSVLQQTYSRLEILLIDDGSPDNCPEICDSFMARDSRVRVIHKSNGGLADARNTGLDAIRGEYVAFLDSDDWVELVTYEKMMSLMLDHQEIDIVCCAASRVLDAEDRGRCFNYYASGTILSGSEVTRRILLDEIGSQVVKGLYRAYCWDGVRFPLKQLYEDIPTTYQAFFRARAVGFINEPYYKYRINYESISTTQNPIKPYHIYLGFKAHYDFARKEFAEIVGRCCANTAHYAISTYFHYCADKSFTLESAVKDVMQFLEENRERIVQNYLALPISSRRLALQTYYFSRPLFILGCKMLHHLGLQKILGFNEK